MLATSLLLLGSAVVVGGVESGSCSGGNCYFKGSEGGFIAVGVGLLALGGLSIASAATGYDRTSDCRRMQETPPGQPHPSASYLLDVGAIARVRAGAEDPPPSH